MLMTLWDEWLNTDPGPPFYQSWEEFATQHDDPLTLFDETRVYVKRVRNELRDMEVPKTFWQKAAKALAAAAGVFVLVFLALSRVLARASE